MKFQNTTGGIGVVQNQNDILLIPTSITPNPSVSRQVTTQHGYSSVGVYQSRTAGPGQPVYATVQNLSSGGQTTFGAAMLPVPGSGATNQWQCILPCDNSPGDLLTVTVYWIQSVFNTTFGNLTIFGSTSTTGIPQMRSDGRAYPVGQFGANVQTTAGGTSTVIQSPTTPLRILLQTCYAGSSGGALVMAMVVNGSNCGFQSVGNPPSAAQAIPSQGILLDTGSIVALNGNGTSIQQASVFYDLVA